MSGKIPVAEIISECDRLFNAGQGVESGAYLEHWQLEAVKCGDLSGELSIVNELVGFYRMNKLPAKGKQAVSRALELIEKLDISDTVSGGTILLNCASALHSFCELDNAMELFQRSYASYAKNLAPDDLNFAGLLNNMSSIYADNGDFHAACACCMEASDILYKNRKIMDHAVALVNLIQLYLRFEPDSAKIPRLISQAFECFDAPEVPRDGYYAHTCIKCAPVFSAAGRKDYETELLKRAEKIYEKCPEFCKSEI